VLAALQHERPDRTPRDFWAEPPTWNRLLAYVRHGDRERVLQHLGVDIRHLDAIAPPERKVGHGLWRNMWGEQYVYKETGWGPMRQDVTGALARAQSLSELESFDWPQVDDLDYSQLLDACERHQEYALVYGSADVWQRPALVRGWQRMFIDMVERPEWAHFLGRTFCDFYLEDYTRAAEITNGRFDLYLLISDLGSQRAPLISPTMFREFVAPYVKRMVDCIHSLSGRVLFHSCGAIHPLIQELVEVGIDMLDPIQPVGPEMRPERLKCEFGHHLTFHGGIDAQALLPRGTPADIRAEVRRYCRTLGEGGGYVLSPAHFFQPDVPPENIIAVYDEAP